ncbi:MAG: non-heme iron oxygenase ferredoxin subunit [Pseudomonadota bacterium]
MDDSLTFIDIMASSDLPTGTTKKFATDVGDILFVNVDGKFYAIDDMCTHEDSSLSLGCLKGELVSCTLHGSRFNVRTGEPMEEPATQPLRRYPIRVHNDRIEVCLTPKS